MSDFKTSWFSVSLATYTVDTGTIFKKMETKNNQRIADLAEFAEKVRQAYANLDSEGFDVVNVIRFRWVQVNPASTSVGGTWEMSDSPLLEAPSSLAKSATEPARRGERRRRLTCP